MRNPKYESGKISEKEVWERQTSQSVPKYDVNMREVFRSYISYEVYWGDLNKCACAYSLWKSCDAYINRY